MSGLKLPSSRENASALPRRVGCNEVQKFLFLIVTFNPVLQSQKFSKLHGFGKFRRFLFRAGFFRGFRRQFPREHIPSESV